MMVEDSGVGDMGMEWKGKRERKRKVELEGSVESCGN